MPDKKMMTLKLLEEEMKSSDRLALRNDMTKTVIIKKAIRICLVLEARLLRGEHIFVEDMADRGKVELLLYSRPPDSSKTVRGRR
jgi:hypothetical protein